MSASDVEKDTLDEEAIAAVHKLQQSVALAAPVNFDQWNWTACCTVAGAYVTFKLAIARG